ncbi:MAG: NADH-quinone oxidoreductase subunit C [Deltaproteobacteria bacterium]|nr:NADH-quinone oxidoreductase subunit C [Deltaproteobacteria bacterium]
MTDTVEPAALLAERFGLAEAPEGMLVPREKLAEFARTVRHELGFAWLTYITAAHHPAEPEKKKGDTVIPAVPASYVVAYHARNLEKNQELTWRCRVALDEKVPSVFPSWAGADWQEREAYDLVGPVFDGHPDLRRIMLPEDWEGHPLHRDYAIDTPHKPWR